MSLRKYVSRYVVPFYYDYNNQGYQKIRTYFAESATNNQELGLPKDGQWVKAGFWENYRSDRKTQAEMDIYSYLPSVFLEEEYTNENDISNLGISFVYKTSGKLFELEYRHEDKRIPIDCKELGVLLLRNGIGFIWYETEFKGAVSTKEYVAFQHEFKELARTHEERIVRKTGFDKESKEGIYKSICMGEWLSATVSADDLGIRFWAERETKHENGNRLRIPDKALLFQYLFIETLTDQERYNLIFQVANGYENKYNAPKDIEQSLYRPFGNVSFYISKAGMACVAENDESNETFFDGQFREKYVRDYFFIYMLLSYQSYSCAHYSRLLTKLPADEGLFNQQLMYADQLESLNRQINLFLVKSVFESVSNIHHQNGVYRYGKSALSIEEDIQSLTTGLGALEEMVKDKRKQKDQAEEENRNRKVDRALAFFGLMVVVSALLDGLNLVDWFMNKDSNISYWHIAIIAVIILLTVYLIIVLLRNRKRKEQD